MNKHGAIGQITGEALEITKGVGKGLGEIAAKTGEEIVKQVGINPNSEDSQQKLGKSPDIKSLQKKDDKFRGKEIAEKRAFLQRLQEEGQSYHIKQTQEMQQKAVSQTQQVEIEKRKNAAAQATAQSTLATTGSINRKPGLFQKRKLPSDTVERGKWDKKSG